MKKLTLSTLICSAVFSFTATAAPIADGIKEAMKSPLRTEKEIARDRNREPVETLTFFNIQDDSRVIELVPGGGWYTKLLAPALKENGKLYVSLGASRVEKNLLDKSEFSEVSVLPAGDISYDKASRSYKIEPFEWDVKPVDAVLTFRNYHNFNEASRRLMNEQSFKALKPGGVYGIVDHTRRHMQQDDNENGRRVDPVLVIKEVQEAGFQFVNYSTHLYRLDDELRYEVGRKSVTGNTDRFTLLFIKPE